MAEASTDVAKEVGLPPASSSRPSSGRRAAAAEAAPAEAAPEGAATGAAPPAKTNDEKVAQIISMKAANPNNIAVQQFDKAMYDALPDDEQKTAFLKCLDSGRENADSGMGCYANKPDDYKTFNEFFKKALSAYHKVDLNVKKHTNNWKLEGIEGLPEDGKLDFAKLNLPALSMRVRTGRNLNKFPLPGSMSQEDRVNMEAAMLPVFKTLVDNKDYGGQYYTLTPGEPVMPPDTDEKTAEELKKVRNSIDEAKYQELVKAHIMFKDMAADPYLTSAGIASHWPHGRGCYVSEDQQFIIWVGEEDHLRIMCMRKTTVLNEVFDRLKTAVDLVETLIPGGCAMDADFGVVTSCPTNIGTGMRASVHIALPNLTSDGTDAKAKEVAKPLGLSVRGLGGEHTPIGADGTVDISPSARFCITEAEIITALYNGVKALKEKEDNTEPAKAEEKTEDAAAAAAPAAAPAAEEKKE